MTAPAPAPPLRSPAPTEAGSLDRRLAILTEVVVPVGYAVATLLLSTTLRKFETNEDEGINLVKAALLARGHALYEDVWSDQPPLFTEMLRALFAVVGESVFAARALVLATACLLLFAVARIARRVAGPRAALVTSLLLLVFPPFQRLSVSVMIGLPALAFGALAFACAAEEAGTRRRSRAAASGAFLALGVLTKLSVALLAPAVLFALVLAQPRGARAGPALLWLAAFLGTAALGFLALAGPLAVEQLVAPHVTAATDPDVRVAPGHGFRGDARRVAWLAVFAIPGAVVALRRRRTVAAPLVAWAVTAAGALAVHRPLFTHHLLLLTVPAALLAAPAALAAGNAVADRVGTFLARRKGLRRALALAAVVSGALLVADAGDWRHRARAGSTTLRAERVVEALRALARPGDSVLTDRPMFAFRAGVPVVPEAAVFTWKRQRTGFLSERRLETIVAEERPALVLLGRFRLPTLRAGLRSTYRLALGRGDLELFVRDAPDGVSCVWPHCLREPAAWYGGAEARRLAENVLRGQHRDGGWAKHEDRAFRGLVGADEPPFDGENVEGRSTIDDGATTTEMALLARVHAATGDGRFVEGFLRGLDHILHAQTPSGGWPQVPGARRGAYPAAITLNDGAMAHVMELLDAVATEPAFAFVDPARRARAADAFTRGVACLVRAQVRVGGETTVWCAQHDPETLAPVGARTYEPPSLSGLESVGAVRVLMRVRRPGPDVVEAVEAGVRWFRAHPLPGDGPPRWARFYDLGTSTPIWPDRDGTRKASLSELSSEREAGYHYVTDAPRALLDVDHPRWRASLAGAR